MQRRSAPTLAPFDQHARLHERAPLNALETAGRRRSERGGLATSDSRLVLQGDHPAFCGSKPSNDGIPYTGAYADPQAIGSRAGRWQKKRTRLDDCYSMGRGYELTEEESWMKCARLRR